MRRARLPARRPARRPSAARPAAEAEILELRTDPEYVMKADDEILIVAEDDSTIAYRPQPVAKPTDLEIRDARIQPARERMLLLGWSEKAPILIREYSEYVLEGSEAHVMIRARAPTWPRPWTS